MKEQEVNLLMLRIERIESAVMCLQRQVNLIKRAMSAGDGPQFPETSDAESIKYAGKVAREGKE